MIARARSRVVIVLCFVYEMPRYLLFFSYIGTQFRGSQRQWIAKARNEVDTQTIQGLLEVNRKPKNDPISNIMRFVLNQHVRFECTCH